MEEDVRHLKKWRKRFFGDSHPVRRGSWKHHRLAMGYWRNWPKAEWCEWCGGELDSFEHEDDWDVLRGTFLASGNRAGYVQMPEWFPVFVCKKCGVELTPFVEALVDIGMLRIYCRKLEGVICNVRKHESRRTENNWSAPLHISECRALCS